MESGFSNCSLKYNFEFQCNPWCWHSQCQGVLNAPFKEVAMPTGTYTVIRFYKEHCQDVETNFELAMK